MENIKSFFKLTVNENIKNFFRIKTIIWALFLVAFITASALLNKAPEYNSNTWKENAKTQIQQLKKKNNKLKSNNLKSSEHKDVINIDLGGPNGDTSSDSYKKNTIEIQKLEFAIDNDIPIGVTNPWTFITNNIKLGYSLVFIFILVSAINIISLEHKNNTMKQLLIRPHSRYKILLSKFSSIIFSLLFSCIFTLLAIFLIGVVLYSKNGMDLSMIRLIDGKFIESNVLIYSLKYTLYFCIQCLPLFCLSFLISLLFKSNTLAIIISYGFSVFASVITLILPKASWVKYTLFPNLDLTPYLSGNTPFGFKGMSLGFSITMLLAYSILFLAVSIGFFKKKDIA